MFSNLMPNIDKVDKEIPSSRGGITGHELHGAISLPNLISTSVPGTASAGQDITAQRPGAANSVRSTTRANGLSCFTRAKNLP
jgi:hypothetical protein